ARQARSGAAAPPRSPPGAAGRGSAAGTSGLVLSRPSSPPLALSGRRRIVRRLLTPHRGEIVLGDVFPHHALRRESRARRAQRLLHLLHPTVRDTLGITVV